jgi:hypothetical protein
MQLERNSAQCMTRLRTVLNAGNASGDLCVTMLSDAVDVMYCDVHQGL